MDFSSLISEEKIKKAYKNGEFENLPGFGKPLPKDKFAAVPAELRMAFRVLSNAGYNVEEDQLKQELLSIEDLLRACREDEERNRLQTKYREKLMRLNKLMENRRKNNTSSFIKYQQKIESEFWRK
ncbi:DnaJ family domain-containing protein [Niallia nealsonii]|uniref:DUF1992 domain-containing protein n=1 Tax=Niallia nealsonii TaxID=115979 RepID=A0A2N0Z0I5_9BACI|nr:DUF1992 domain-containing protein [Niallia nealsonii]PKG23026.1 DUF1992 domain-containing protein [Niallia nealsonii]